MATRRTEIEVAVLGLSDLQALNTALNVHDKRLQALTASYLAFNAAVSGASGGMKQFITNNVTTNNTLNQTDNTLRNATISITKMGSAASGASGQFGGLLGTMLKYRAVSAVFEEVQKAVGSVVQAMNDMEKQAARVARVSGSGSIPLSRANFAEEAARTGASIEQIGEAAYQIAPFVKDANAQFAALRTTMNLVIGTESDARETARALIQIYNEFGDQLDQTVSKQENLTRIGNMMAIMFTETNTEVNEVVNSIKYLGPVAAAARVPLENMLALVGALDKAGLRSSTAGTSSASFISGIITRYQTKLPGKDYGGIQYKGKDFGFDLARDATTGGIDPIQTLQNIADRMDELRKRGRDGQAQADLFWKAVSGTERASRAVGAITTINGALDDARRLMAKLREEHNHTSDAAEKLQKTMLTTAQEFQRVWGGAISAVSNMIDHSGLRGFFHAIAADIDRAAEAARNAAASRMSQSDQTTNLLAGNAGPRQRVSEELRILMQAQQTLAQHRASPLDNALTQTHAAQTGAAIQFLEGRYGSDYSTTFDREGLLRALDRDIEERKRLLRGPLLGATVPVTPFDPFSPGSNVHGLPGFAGQRGAAISESQKTLDKNKAELERKQEEARRALLEKTKSQLAAAEADLEIKQKLYPTVGGRVDDRVSGQAGMVDLLRGAVARLNEDPLDRATELKKLKYGIGTSRSQIDEEVAKQKEELAKSLKQENEDKAKEHAAFLEYYAELAQEKYGPTSPTTKLRAMQAQDAAIALATGIDKQKLMDGTTGPMKLYYEALREAAEKLREQAQAAHEATEAEQDFAKGYRQGFAQRDMTDYERRAQTRQYGLRPNMLAGGFDSRQEKMLTDDIADIQGTIKAMARNATSEQLDEMRRKLEAANAALTDFHDTLDQKAYAKRAQADQDAYQLRDLEINHLHKLKFYKDQDQADADMVRKLGELAASAQANLEKVAATNNGVGTPEADAARREARKRVDEAEQNLSDFKIEARLQRYQDAYNTAKTTVHGALSDFLHGQGDAGTVLQRVGGSIVDASIDSFIKKWADPLVQTITSEILAIQDLTNTMSILNTTMTGGGGGGSPASMASAGLGAVVAAGVGAGIADAAESGAIAGGAAGADDGGRKGVAGSGRGPSDLQRGLGAGLAAYSIGANAAQQGVNVGNILGSAVTGLALGGPIGAGIGIAADLIGGLFHHSNTPTATPQDLNPAYFNAPSAFDVAAYNYSAYGKLPRVQDVGFDVNPQNAPIVNVYVDGAKVAAERVITRQVSSATVSLSSPFMDRHTPV